LDVAATGVEVDAKGFIVVDEYLETSVPGIWALGDIVGKFMLKHNANWEWWYADHNMFNRGPKKAVDYHAMPRAVFSSPQIGSVGLTEEQLQEQWIPYVAGSWEYIWGAYGIAIDDRDGLVKVLAHPETREILGCHIIGTDASTLIQEVANAMRLHLTTDAFSQGIYIHLALPEVIYRAFRSVPGTKVPPV
jgi:mycothione reductase